MKKTNTLKSLAIVLIALFTIPTFSYSQTNIVLTPNSYLLAKVDKNIQDTVIKRLHMDLNPDIEHLRNTAQVVRTDIPAVDFSSLKSVPVISTPRILTDSSDPNSHLWIDKEFACFYGKTAAGEDIYIYAIFKDWSKVQQDVNSPNYQARVKLSGKEKTDAAFKRLQSRKGADCWRVLIFKNGDNKFQDFDYARKQSDDGKFFILTKGKNHFDICYFKDGKPICSHKPTKFNEIWIDDFYTLVN